MLQAKDVRSLEEREKRLIQKYGDYGLAGSQIARERCRLKEMKEGARTIESQLREIALEVGRVDGDKPGSIARRKSKRKHRQVARRDEREPVGSEYIKDDTRSTRAPTARRRRRSAGSRRERLRMASRIFHGQRSIWQPVCTRTRSNRPQLWEGI